MKLQKFYQVWYGEAGDHQKNQGGAKLDKAVAPHITYILRSQRPVASKQSHWIPGKRPEFLRSC